MFVSQTIVGFLDRCGVEFDVVVHRHSATSLATARAAHVDPQELAKGVLLQDADEYVLAIVPASRQLNRWAVQELLDLPQLLFAEEQDLAPIFRDCEPGAVPAIGPAFGLKTAVDDELLRRSDVYVEGGDHEHLVHLRGEAFARIMQGQPHGPISY